MSLAVVTGGGGFIGSHVVAALVASGRHVRVLALPHEDVRNLRGLPVELVHGDVRSPDTLRDLVRGAETVFHLAAVFALWTRERGLMEAVNVEGTRNVLAASLSEGVSRVVYTSSIARFGGQGAGRNATETSPFALGATGNEYALSKMRAHEVALSFVARGLDVVTVAPCGPIGPGDVGPTPTGRLLVATLRAPLVVAVDSATNMLDVRDMATGHLLAESRGKTGETYLLGAHDVSMLDVARAALRHAGLAKPILRVPFSLASLGAHPYAWLTTRLLGRAPLVTPSAVAIARLGLRADCSKAKRELGLPTRPLDESIRDAVNWFFDEGYVTKQEKPGRLPTTPRPKASAGDARRFASK